jgi:REP element-mobilizing transposase RayT
MLPRRKHPRLRHYAYNTPGAYFVTICSDGRRCTFGRIVNGEFVPSRLGRLVLDELRAMEALYSGTVRLDQFVVMPNHLHFIVFLVFQRPVDSAPQDESIPRRRLPQLAQVVRGLKAGITRKWWHQSGVRDQAVFQKGYYEHVIRHELALERIREYIVNNPRQWELDRENTERRGEDPFHRWLEAYGKRLKTADP